MATPCLNKPGLVRDMNDSIARYVTARRPSFPLQVRHKRPILHSGQRNNSGPKKSRKQRFNAYSVLGQAHACEKGGGGGYLVWEGGSRGGGGGHEIFIGSWGPF